MPVPEPLACSTHALLALPALALLPVQDLLAHADALGRDLDDLVVADVRDGRLHGHFDGGCELHGVLLRDGPHVGQSL